MRVASVAGRSLLVLFVAALVVACPACSSGRKPVYPVHGRVLVKGKPAARAQITFHPVNDTTPEAIHPVGSVDENGHFQLTSYRQGDGAPEGEYRVTVQWFLATRPRGSADFVTVNYLPAALGRAETSGLQAKIGKGDNELPVFQLLAR